MRLLSCRHWSLVEGARSVDLGPHMLLQGRLNTWEAKPVTAAPGNETIVWQWVPGAKEDSGSTVVLRELSDGPHALLVRALDAAGNRSPLPLQVNWTVDVTAPVSCNITRFNGDTFLSNLGAVYSISRPVNRSAVTMTVAADPLDPGGPLSTLLFHWNSSFGNQASFSVAVETVATASTSLAAHFGLNVTEGAHQLLVHGQDQVGNRSPKPCAEIYWTVDVTPPVNPHPQSASIYCVFVLPSDRCCFSDSVVTMALILPLFAVLLPLLALFTGNADS